MKDKSSDEVSDLRTTLESVQREMSQLRSAVQHVATMTTVENVLAQGFEMMCTELGPLRDLTPKRTLMTDGGVASLAMLRASMARPLWSGAGLLSEIELGVPFIGEVSEDFHHNGRAITRTGSRAS